MMKMNRLAVAVGMAVAVCLCASDVFAQGGGGGGGGGGRGGRGGAGGRGGRGGANFDPAAMQAQQLDNYKQSLEITNDDEWNAIRPLIEKVMTARQETQAFAGGGRGGRGGRGGAGGAAGGGAAGGGAAVGGGRGGQPNPTVEALQTAIDSGSADQIKAALDKYRAARKQAQDKLTEAQDALKKVLKLKQEAVALRMGLVN